MLSGKLDFYAHAKQEAAGPRDGVYRTSFTNL
jgi:hypothetical protein